MRVIKQTYRNRRGTLIHREYKDKRPGHPKGVPNSTYNLSEEGRKAKVKGMLKTIELHRERGTFGQHLKGCTQTLEHRRKNSEGVKRAIAEGRFNPRANIMKYITSDRFEPRNNHGTHGKYYSKKNDTKFRYDSSWELRRMKYLDKSKDIKSYKKNPIRLVYELDGVEHYYFPDLLIKYRDGRKVLEEIKPQGLDITPESKAKFKVARLYCKASNIEFRVINRKKNLKH